MERRLDLSSNFKILKAALQVFGQSHLYRSVCKHEFAYNNGFCDFDELCQRVKVAVAIAIQDLSDEMVEQLRSGRISTATSHGKEIKAISVFL